MIVIIQRILQVLVLVLIVFAIVKADALPAPVQPVALKARAFLIGSEPTWSGFTQTWQTRYNIMASYVPVLQQLAQSAPSTTEISPNTVMNLTINMILIQPAQKWEKIKSDFMSPPAGTSSDSLVQ